MSTKPRKASIEPVDTEDTADTKKITPTSNGHSALLSEKI